MGRLFGTDGVRGVANHELTAELAFNLGKAGAYVLTSQKKHKPRIIVGMDTRISGTMLESAIVAGICSVGAKAICVGIIPTPAVAHLTRLYNADAGVVISASHNPYQFNGIKFFDERGYKLPDALEDQIESIILDGTSSIVLPIGEEIGVRELKHIAEDDYIDYLKKIVYQEFGEQRFDEETDYFKGLKILIDCANGAAYRIAPRILRELGAKVTVIADSPDGVNINEACGSTHLSKLVNDVVEGSYDIGLAFDGDADRVLAVDSDGSIIDGDKIMAMIALSMKEQNKLTHNTIVATVMSNLGLDEMARTQGLSVVKTKVGDRYVLEEMLAKGYVLGGEQSGHIILLEHNTTGDGILTGLVMLSILKKTQKRSAELAAVMNIYPQVLKNAKVSNDKKHAYLGDEMIAAKCQELEHEFLGEGRVLIRPSGTEPLVRVMIEGKDEEYINRRAIELVRLIESRLG